MSALGELDRQLADNDAQNTSFQRNLAVAERTAIDVPLVHVSGKGVLFEELLTHAPYEIPTSSSHPTYFTDDTRRAEDVLGLFRSVYFYAGRACPDFGNIALAFAPAAEAAHTISVTPFDTGGLIHPNRYIRCNLNGAADEGDLIKFCQASEIAGPTWRNEFARFLAAYFEPIQDYWRGRPGYPDPEELFTIASNCWRAWTFEVRFAEPHPVVQCLIAWVGDKRVTELLRQRQAAQPLPLPGAPATVLDKFLEIRPLDDFGTDDFCERLESWIQTQLGL